VVKINKATVFRNKEREKMFKVTISLVLVSCMGILVAQAAQQPYQSNGTMALSAAAAVFSEPAVLRKQPEEANSLKELVAAKGPKSVSCVTSRAKNASHCFGCVKQRGRAMNLCWGSLTHNRAEVKAEQEATCCWGCSVFSYVTGTTLGWGCCAMTAKKIALCGGFGCLVDTEHENVGCCSLCLIDGEHEKANCCGSECT
jgi:hypothetical protein